MAHVSADGPARPPYVNVAFQQEGKLEARQSGVALSHVLQYFLLC